MALDNSRLCLENKLLGNKSGRIFCFRPVYFKKSEVKHVWGETVLWDAFFIIQTSDKMQNFTIFQDKLHSFNIQNHRSKRGLLAKPVQINQIKSINQYSEPSRHEWTFSETRSKNFQNHLYGYRFSLLTSANFAVNIKRVTLLFFV